MRTLSASLVAVALLAACNSGSSNSNLDMPASTGDMTRLPDLVIPSNADLWSCCGHPGDPGNEIGVGKYCESFDDCASTSGAKLCSSIADSTRFFCTTTCTVTDGGTNTCGSNAECQCAAQGCGCVPLVCLANLPAGC